MPVVYELIPANTDERKAADAVFPCIWQSDIFADKGFIGEEWQAEYADVQGNQIWTPRRANQLIQNPIEFDRRLNALRGRIEGAFNGLQNAGRNLERLLR